jgi:hypothetical protein
MDQVVKGMTEFGIPQMVIIGQTARILNLPETVIDLISQRAPTYRKYVKRREKTETIKCQETSIQIVPDRQRINVTENLSTGPIMTEMMKKPFCIQ